MRILYWADSYWPYLGGIEVMGARFLAGLKQRGCEPAVITSHREMELPDEEVHEGIPIHRFRFHEALAARRLDLFAGLCERLAQLKRRFRPDLIHFNFPAPGGVFHWQTRSAWETPTLIAVHTKLPEREAGPDTLMGKLLGHSAWVTANSNATLADVRAAAPGLAERSSVVYNGLEPPAIAPEPLPFDPPVLVCVGRLTRKKGIDVAVSALAEIRRRVANARLVIAGDGPERSSLEALASTLGLTDGVKFRGWVPPAEMPRLLNSATMALVPSRYPEPFGNVALEAMQMARPVIAADAGGLPEVVADGETGWLVRQDNPPALAEAVGRLLVAPSLARRMGETGRRRALERFTMDRHLDGYERLYRRLAVPRRAATGKRS